MDKLPKCFGTPDIIDPTCVSCQYLTKCFEIKRIVIDAVAYRQKHREVKY